MAESKCDVDMDEMDLDAADFDTDAGFEIEEGCWYCGSTAPGHTERFCIGTHD